MALNLFGGKVDHPMSDPRQARRIVDELPAADSPKAMAEIAGDMKSPHRMMRLLQGDVGSGKTVVALLAMLIAVESGGQAALLAPTEVLARQHHQTLRRLAAPAGVEIGLLTGREKGRARDSMLATVTRSAPLPNRLTPIGSATEP